MRYPAIEKLEIIQLVEQSHLPARRTLQKLGISPPINVRKVDAEGPPLIQTVRGVGYCLRSEDEAP